MERVTLQGYGCTDIGHNRSLNEDFYDMNSVLFILADGMGGHNAGEIASTMTVDGIMRSLGTIDTIESYTHSDAKQVQQMIHEAIKKTNETIYERSIQDIKCRGMGTTLVLALLQEPQTIHIANVGDSRAYVLRSDTLKVLTEDHSVTADMLRDGTITKSESKTHPYRHYLSRSIGTSKNIEANLTYLTVLPNDKLLLCSDGLWDVLSDKKIKDILQDHTTPRKTCEKFIAKANEHDSQDNISCIVIKISEKKR